MCAVSARLRVKFFYVTASCKMLRVYDISLQVGTLQAIAAEDLRIQVRCGSGQFCSKLAVLRPAAYKGALRGNADDSSDRRNCIRSRAVLPCEGRTGAEGGTA